MFPMRISLYLAYFFEGDAPDAAREQDLLSLKAASAAWRARWCDQLFAPQLTMTAAGTAHLVSDTRACALQPFYCPTQVEVAVLNRLRNPSTRPNAVAQLADRLDATTIEAAMDTVLMRQFAIEIDGRMLSLVTEAGREISMPKPGPSFRSASLFRASARQFSRA